MGSENYADFRQQLLPWSECEPKIAEYCAELGIPDTPEKFVSHLQNQLTKVAREVDLICQQGDQITINEEGIPVLKRITAQDKPDGAETLLFDEVAEWKLIQTHWQDLMRVVLSIKAGKLLPSAVLRKLGSYIRRGKGGKFRLVYLTVV